MTAYEQSMAELVRRVEELEAIVKDKAYRGASAVADMLKAQMLTQPLVVAGVQPYPRWQNLGELDALVKAATLVWNNYFSSEHWSVDYVHELKKCLKPFEAKPEYVHHDVGFAPAVALVKAASDVLAEIDADEGVREPRVEALRSALKPFEAKP